MKVCFINTNKAWGGGEKWHYQMAKTLASLGHEVTVITHFQSELKKKLANEKVAIKSFAIGKLSFLSPLSNYKIFKFFKSQKFDSIIMNLPSDVKAFARAAFHAGITKRIYRRGMNHPIKGTIINKYIYPRFITDIIANSEDVKKSVSLYIPELKNKTHVIFNGINIKNIKKNIEKVSQKKILIGNLGRLVEQKGQSDFISIAKILQKKNIDFEILIAGDGPLKQQLQQQIDNESLQEKIILLGKKNVEDFFARIDYFVFPSRFEGLSNALLEALEFRKPIICYDAASNAEIVIDGNNGFLIKAFDTNTMAQKIIDLYRNPGLYQQMQIAGEQTLINKFDQDKMIKKLVEVITP